MTSRLPELLPCLCFVVVGFQYNETLICLPFIVQIILYVYILREHMQNWESLGTESVNI